jgi:membrane protein DedA with SNARE-associated domain
MARLVHLIVLYGVPLIFLNVFLEQIGAPVPAAPTLIVAGALSREGRMSSTHVLIASVLASLLADWIWFVLGRHYGYRILRLLCRVSLSPDSCVRDTEARFERWGLKSLLIAKFIPGFSTVAPPLAGAARRSTVAFLIYDGIGAVLWAGSAVAAGRAFHHAIERVLIALENLGWWAVVIVAFAVALLILIKWSQRRGFYKQLRMARVSVDELKEMMDRGEEPLVVDARSAGARNRDPRRIPRAITVDGFENIPADREIIVYCT